MSASKLALYGIGTALFRNRRTATSTVNSPFLFFKPIPFAPPLFHRRASSSSAAADEETVFSVDQHHPWPEWVSFVDRLKTKGYLTKRSSSNNDESVYINIYLLKDACLSFSRDRYDLFKLLALKDIQSIVEGGCPNVLRKPVNSAKRLRAHLRLDEGDVCSACNLRGSCDRAYVILKEFEADARTVDIVRILLFYALDPLVLSGGEKPPGREVIESSARKLLSQLIELSESYPAPPPAPAHSKLTAQDSVAKGQPLRFMTNKLSKDVEMKKGDWMCPKCNFMNFSRNMHCLECNEDRPKDIDLLAVEMKQGDWNCPECSFLNFSRNTRCLKCKTEGPSKRGSTGEVEIKKGDWTCKQCGFINYARNLKCLRCPEQRPKKHPGDWSCPKCDFYNFNRNTACMKCNTKCPKEQATNDYNEHIWRRSN
ncbi:zinc finger protein VAR3, chloroplastic [Gastrolobium bilobum]|uniref:zinc finger protein VAR3, chloroplastic n=1 Tax=Gastrolobium bilobum TaxID=150636 RepID=UPI002AB0A0F4|nr:zinc finger protein VAR3, chloroplastic [Gastrolobium bilobum]